MDTVWCAEAARDPFIPLGIVASSTDRVAVGTGIAVAFARSPYATAQAAWDLQLLSGGRMRLGLATQVRAHIERRYGVDWPGGVSALREYIQCCRAIWDTWQHETPPRFEGEHFRFTMTNPEFIPAALDDGDWPIPIWIAAVTPRSARLAGEVGDGLHVHAFHTESYLREVLLPAAAGPREAAGRAGTLPATCPVFAGIAHDERQAAALRQDYRQQVAFYSSTRGYLPVLRHSGLDHLHEPLRELARERRWQEMTALVGDDVLDRFVVIDEPKTLARKLLARYGGVLSELSLYRTSDRFASDDDMSVLIEGLAERESGTVAG